MSFARSPSTSDDFQYAGAELDVFAHAANWKRYFASQLRPFIAGRVLEVGAGLGATTRALCTGNEASWTCLEPDAALAARMEQGLESDNPPCPLKPRVVVGTLDQLAADERFDSILYIDVLEHIEDDGAELRKAALHLAPGGNLAVLSPAHQWLFSPFDEAIGHYRRYRRSTLRRAGPADCRLVRMRYLDGVGLLASAANRALLKSSQPTVAQVRLWDRAMVPISRWLDPLLAYRLGKSIVAVWQR